MYLGVVALLDLHFTLTGYRYRVPLPGAVAGFGICPAILIFVCGSFCALCRGGQLFVCRGGVRVMFLFFSWSRRAVRIFVIWA